MPDCIFLETKSWWGLRPRQRLPREFLYDTTLKCNKWGGLSAQQNSRQRELLQLSDTWHTHATRVNWASFRASAMSPFAGRNDKGNRTEALFPNRMDDQWNTVYIADCVQALFALDHAVFTDD
jgi:hypothetical protein